jgi:hypothetical protein
MRTERVGGWAGCFVAALLVSLTIAASAVAAPTVTFTPSFGAGDHLSEAGTLSAGLTFAGTEYEGDPEPLTALKLYLPAGTTLSNAGFATCEKSVLLELGPEGCPAGSKAGPTGSFKLIFPFGAERPVEEGTTEAFFAPGGGFNIYLFGHVPTILEFVEEVSTEVAGSPFGEALKLSFPLIETFPGSPDASFSGLELKLGATREEGLISSLALPSECAGKLSWAADAGYNGASAKRVAATETACPSAATGEGARKLQEAEAKKTGAQAAEAAAKKAAEEAAARKAAEEAAARARASVQGQAAVKILATKLTARGLRVTVRLSAAGTVTITGPGLKKSVVHLAAGSHTVNVGLTKAGTAERRAHKKIKLSVALKVGTTSALSSLKIKL